MIKTIIFDNNGVLTTCDDNRTIPEFSRFFGVDEQYLREKFHRVVAPADLGHITTDQFFDNLAAELGKTFDRKALWSIFRNCYILIPEMRDLLINLKNNYRIVLLTNFVDAFDEINEKMWHYDEIFEKENIFVSSHLRLAKPNKDFYEYALKQLDCEPSETIFVDDRPSNLITARELGINTILFVSPKQCKNELQSILEENNGEK